MKKILLSLLLSIFLTGANTSAQPGCILLDFNGHNIDSAILGYTNFSPAGLSDFQQEQVKYRVQYLFQDFQVIVTTSDSIFNTHHQSKRVRCVISENRLYIGWTQLGGIAEIGSMTIPVIVSTTGLSYETRIIGDAVAHEVGHALGLKHQSLWFRGIKHEEYHPGNSFEAPIMGLSYYTIHPRWIVGVNREGKWQDDKALIAKTFPLKPLPNYR